MSDAIVPAPEPESKVTLFGSTDPVAVVERAGKIANVLADLIRQRGLSVNIQRKDYVLVEGWTTLGSILGVFPIVTKTAELKDDEGRLYGFEATVEARTRSGEIIGAGIARCTRDENRWKGADDYAILSMASTRATSKALRLPLGWVMRLAGYEATPAEEMDAVADRSTSQKRTDQRRHVEVKARTIPPVHEDIPQDSPSDPTDDPRYHSDSCERPKREAMIADIVKKQKADVYAAAERAGIGIKGRKLDELADDELGLLWDECVLPTPF